MPIVIGLLPGILVGTAIVSRVSPGWLRFATYIALLPLILLQAAGFRREDLVYKPFPAPPGSGKGRTLGMVFVGALKEAA